MKLHSSTKIAVGFVLLVGLAYFGYQFYTRNSVANLHFDPVVPAEVNVVGIDPGAGFKIIVANDIAQLVQASDKFGGSDSNDGGPEEGSIKFRIPVKEMLGAFRGDPKSLGEFVAIMNDMRQNEKWPTVHVVWTAEDLQKAISGDKTLEQKLVKDLNMELDGTPLPVLRPASLENGIIVDYPVSLTVMMNGKPKEVVGRIQQPYRPQMMSAIDDQLTNQRVTKEMMAGYYAQAAKHQQETPNSKENIRSSIANVISKSNADRLREAPERVLKSATVVINEHQIENSSYHSYDIQGKQYTDLTIDLTDEGRQRLWKYSVDKVGSNLLLVVQGVAIAAPRIQTALTEQELTIHRMPDLVLVKDAVERLNAASGKKVAQAP